MPVFVKLLDDNSFRAPAINLLARFDDREISAALLKRFTNFAAADRTAALQALTSRPSFALALLDAVAAGRLPRDQLTAFHITRLLNLKNADVDKRVNNGETAAMVAAQYNPVPGFIEALGAAGADFAARNAQGKSALDLAREHGNATAEKALLAR